MQKLFTRLSALTLLSILLPLSAPAFATEANPQVTFDTNKGKIVVELFADKAPETVKNFLHYVDMGLYDKTILHRVIRDHLVQGGAFNHFHKMIPVYDPIKNEAGNGIKNERGTLAMFHTRGPHSATSQFFINLKHNKEFDHKDDTDEGYGYAVFGKIVKGEEVLKKLELVRVMNLMPTGKFSPKFPVSVRRITRTEPTP